MPRTYLKSTGSQKAGLVGNPLGAEKAEDMFGQLKKKGKVGGGGKVKVEPHRGGWRGKVNSSSSEEENDVQLRPLSPLRVQNRIGKVNSEDLFDQLFENVNTDRMRLPGQTCEETARNFSTDGSSAASRSDNSCFGLFSSFNSDPMAHLVERKRKKSSRTRRIKTGKKIVRNKENVDQCASDTLKFDIKFAGTNEVASLANLQAEALPCQSDHSDVFSPCSPSRLSSTSFNKKYFLNSKTDGLGVVDSPAFFFQTPGARKTTKTLSCLTSTPLLRSLELIDSRNSLDLASQDLEDSSNKQRQEAVNESLVGDAGTGEKTRMADNSFSSTSDEVRTVDRSNADEKRTIDRSNVYERRAFDTSIAQESQTVDTSTTDKLQTVDSSSVDERRTVDMINVNERQAVEKSATDIRLMVDGSNLDEIYTVDRSIVDYRETAMTRYNDEVFSLVVPPTEYPNQHLQFPPPDPRTSALSSEEIFPTSPDVWVNMVRGRKQMAGPALSLMNHFNWKRTMAIMTVSSNEGLDLSTKQPDTNSPGGGNVSTKRIVNRSAQGLSVSRCKLGVSVGRSDSDKSDDKNSYIDIIVYCICREDGNERDVPLVMCDGCSYYFHADCVGLDDEALAEIVRYEPEWFCPPCLAEKPRRNSSTSFLQASSRSGGLDSPSDPVETTETKCSNIDVGARHAKCVEYEIILPFTGPDPEDRVEVAARPGKNWRRSIMTNLTNGLNISLGRRTSMAGPRMSSVHREANINSEFTAPELPINDRRSSKRLSSRVSSITTRPTHFKSQLQELSEEAELDGVPRCLRADPERSILNRGPRPNFYIVPNTLPHDLDESAGEAHTSILVQPGTSELEKLLACCSVNKIVAFDEVYDANSLLHSRKIGEGAFGEVFLVGSETVDKPVLKVVPIGGSIKVNDEEQTRLADMMSEVVISSSLSNLRFGKNNFTEGFVEVRKCIVFQGEYPVQLLNLWDEFDLEKRSENTRPDYLPRDQLYMALEFNNGGKDLEKYEFRNASQALAAWKQVAHTLAVAEAALNFEHRDLHWGNVLIKETARKKVNYQISGQNYSVETNGVEITIIDFSLSRLRSGEDSCTIFKNLAEDPTLFTALGLDRGGDYQFDIYRLMRKENGNNWENFHPKTNIFWLHYMLEKMMTEVYYMGKKNSKPHKSGLALMRSVKGSLLEFNSARDWVTKEGVLVLN